MKSKRTALATLAVVMGSFSAHADPCGMVPPISPDGSKKIVRIGIQRTYVFYRDGVETFVIRPGFDGNVEEFGMLTPFPSPPAMRKVPDQVFEHLGAAIDPPEVYISAWQGGFGGGGLGGGGGGLGGGGGFGGGGGGLGIQRNEVRVLSEEGIGQYSMAVLAAGSAEALKKWMDQHGYVYPKGMDAACEDYVQKGWCFVAGKNRVSAKSTVAPKPGMKNVKAELPAGAKFDGHIQAMAFRFKSNKLEIPMRLSAFNPGPSRNVVYLLTDGPQKLTQFPASYVVRQISGERLYANLTQPLPILLAPGANLDKLPAAEWQRLRTDRDPDPHLAIARELIAADLLAVRENRLYHPHEEDEKKLLAVCERLDLRGPEVDAAMRSANAVEYRSVVRRGIQDVRGMTLTVLDGDFRPNVVSKENLTMEPFVMDATKNSNYFFDAKRDGPGDRRAGTLISDATLEKQERDRAAPRPSPAGWLVALGLAIAGMGIVGGPLRRRPWVAAAMLLGLFAPIGGGQQPSYERVSTTDLVAKLDEAGGEDRIAELVKRGEATLPDLLGEALAGRSLARRGWAIVALGELNRPLGNRHLDDIALDRNEQQLVRAWAFAARIHQPGGWKLLVERRHQDLYPIANKLLGKAILRDPEIAGDLDKLLRLAVQNDSIQTALQSKLASFGPAALAKASFTASPDPTRLLASGLLGGLAEKNYAETSQAVAGALTFKPEAGQVPWAGGALYIPNIGWKKPDAKRVVARLEAWKLWCQQRGNYADRHKVANLIQGTPTLQQAYRNDPTELFDEAGVLTPSEAAAAKALIVEPAPMPKPKAASKAKKSQADSDF